MVLGKPRRHVPCGPWGDRRPPQRAHPQRPASRQATISHRPPPLWIPVFTGITMALVRPHTVMKVGCTRPPTRAPLTTSVAVASRVVVCDVAPPRSPPGAHKGPPLREDVPAGRAQRGRAGWRRRALWWATLPRPVPRQAPTRDRPYGRTPGAHKGSPLRKDARRPQGIAPTGGRQAPTRDRPYGRTCLRGGRSAVARVGGVARCGGRRCPPVPRQAPTRDRPYGRTPGAHKGSPLRKDARRPQGIAPTEGRQAPTRDRPYGRTPGAHKGPPLREDVPAGRAQRGRAGWRRRALWWATLPRPVPRQAPTRDRPYGRTPGVHKGRPYEGRQAPTRDRPYGRTPGAHKGSPLRGTPGAHKGSPLRFVVGTRRETPCTTAPAS